jgi:apolipoprotein D and lipocalin family protein
MTAPLPPLPASLTSAERLSPDDLDARILQVEQRLIAREENLRRGLSAFGQRLGEATRPRRWFKPALMAGGALAALWLLRPRRSSAAAPAAARRRARRRASGMGGIPWVRLAGLAWPMLPQGWRRHINPVFASTLVTVVLPLVDRLWGSRADTEPSEPLPPLPEVDLARLAGRWFLIGELPAPLEDPLRQPPELGLLPRADGQFDLLQRRIDAEGREHGREALVQPLAGSAGSRLKVSAWPAPLQFLPWAWAEHGVLHVDPLYEVALIGSAARDSLWLLSRSPEMDPSSCLELVRRAQDLGFPTEGLRLHLGTGAPAG